MNKKISVSLASITLSLLTVHLNAQTDSLHHEYNRYLNTIYYKTITPALQSGIVSDISFAKIQSFSSLQLNYTGEYGDYHLVQEAGKISKYGFYAEGALPVKQVYLSGGFRFSQDDKKEIRFTSLLDPFRGTPYQLADSTRSNWKIQNYNMWAKLASELIKNRLSAGLGITLDVARGAKMIDPRPRTNNSNITLQPALTLLLGKHTIGLGGNFVRFRELVDLMLYNSAEPQKIYVLKGIGQYTYDIFSITERERRYNGNGAGAMMSYGFTNNHVCLLAEANYLNYSEEVSDIEYSKPRLRGRYYKDQYQLKVNAQYKKDRILHILKLTYTESDHSGREIIQIFNSDPNVNNWQTDSEAPARWKNKEKFICGSYDWMLINKNKEYIPAGIRLGINYHQVKETYQVMNTFRSYKQMEYELRPFYNWNFKHHHMARFSLTAAISQILNYKSAYKEREADNPTIQNMLIMPDNKIINQNTQMYGAEMGYGYVFHSGSTLLLTGKYRYLFSENHFYRHYPELILSYHF
ncbi:MAG: hypothetical protein RR346_02475 [Bacteroidales bacterium]